MTAHARIGSATACPTCGIPLDSQVFDASEFTDKLAANRTHLLARVELPPRYCGVLEYFSQFTDPAQVLTKAFDWSIQVNGRPLSPYLSFNRVLNPWGFGSFQTAIRLVDGAVIELVARQNAEPTAITQIGGRLVGRYWYNTEYGDVVRPR